MCVCLCLYVYIFIYLFIFCVCNTCVYIYIYIYILCVCIHTHTHTYVDVNNMELLSGAIATQQNALSAFLCGRKTFHTVPNAVILFMSSCRFPDVLVWW